MLSLSLSPEWKDQLVRTEPSFCHDCQHSFNRASEHRLLQCYTNCHTSERLRLLVSADPCRYIRLSTKSTFIGGLTRAGLPICFPNAVCLECWLLQIGNQVVRDLAILDKKPPKTNQKVKVRLTQVGFEADEDLQKLYSHMASLF